MTSRLAGTTASVMNNYWYANGNFSRLGAGTGGTPASTYNTYGNGVDQIRIASFDTTIDFASIDGNDNDGTQLGGADYRFPSASGLDLWVITGASQAETELGLGRLAAPVAAVLGTEVEDAPETQYGSPAHLNGAVVWTPAAFLWQNPAIPVGTDVQWRIKFCDLYENCASTNEMTFSIVTPTYDLTVDKTGTGSGTVSSDPAGIDCGSTCSFDFSHNTDVTLTAVGDSGSTFTGWSGAGCTGTGACEVTMDAAKAVTAEFTLNAACYTLGIAVAPALSGVVNVNAARELCGRLHGWHSCAAECRTQHRLCVHRLERGSQRHEQPGLDHDGWEQERHRQYAGRDATCTGR